MTSEDEDDHRRGWLHGAVLRGLRGGSSRSSTGRSRRTPAWCSTGFLSCRGRSTSRRVRRAMPIVFYLLVVRLDEDAFREKLRRRAPRRQQKRNGGALRRSHGGDSQDPRATCSSSRSSHDRTHRRQHYASRAPCCMVIRHVVETLRKSGESRHRQAGLTEPSDAASLRLGQMGRQRGRLQSGRLTARSQVFSPLVSSGPALLVSGPRR